MWLGVGLGEEAWWLHYKWMEERRGLSGAEELTQGEAQAPGDRDELGNLDPLG